MGYPDIISKVWLVEEEGNQVSSGHLSTLDKLSAVGQDEDLHGHPCEL